MTWTVINLAVFIFMNAFVIDIELFDNDKLYVINYRIRTCDWNFVRKSLLTYCHTKISSSTVHSTTCCVSYSWLISSLLKCAGKSIKVPEKE